MSPAGPPRRARGAPTALIARRRGHSDAWQPRLRKLQLRKTRRCLRRYKQNARRVAPESSRPG
eukprot:8833043-Alexandrium_andersonii.AAC.1